MDSGEETLLDAWRIALAEILDRKDAEWERHCKLMEAQSSVIISRLETQVATLNERINSRLAELKDGKDGEPGPAGLPGAIGPAGPQGEKGERGERGEIGEKGDQGERGEPGEKGDSGDQGERGVPGEKGDPGERGKQGEQGWRGEAGINGSPGERGDPGLVGPAGDRGSEGPAGERGEKGDSGPQGERGERGEAGIGGKDGEKGDQGEKGDCGSQGERGEKGDQGQVGQDGQPGKDGSPGVLREARQFVPGGVNYQSDLVTHNGSTYQARRDTAHAPPHEDWACVAAAGRSAVSPVIRGTWRDDVAYSFLNITALNGSSFIAKCDDPGPCPGDGWQLIASAGKPGKPGPKGDRGDQGPSGGLGAPGRDAPLIKTWKLDRQTYTITPIMSNGMEVESVCIRSLFEQYNEETGRG